MILLYSEILYKFYLNTGIVSFIFYGLLFLRSLFSFDKLFKNYPYLFFYFIICFFFEIFAFSLRKFYDINTKFIDHVYLFFAIVLVSLFYYKIIESKFIKNIVSAILICLLITSFFLAFYNKGYLNPPQTLPYKNLLISILSIFILTKFIQSKKIKTLKSEPLFWFNLGFLFINLFYFILIPMFNYAIDISDNLAFGIGIAKNLIDPIAVIFWCIGIFKLRKYKPTPIASLWP